MSYTILTGSPGIGKTTVSGGLTADKAVTFQTGSEANVARDNGRFVVSDSNLKRFVYYFAKNGDEENALTKFIIKHKLIVVFDSLNELHAELTNRVNIDPVLAAMPSYDKWNVGRAQYLCHLAGMLNTMRISGCPIVATVTHIVDGGVATLSYGNASAQTELIASADRILTLYGDEGGVRMLAPGLRKVETSSGQTVQILYKKFREQQDGYYCPIRFELFPEGEQSISMNSLAERVGFWAEYMEYQGYDIGYKAPKTDEEARQIIDDGKEKANAMRAEFDAAVEQVKNSYGKGAFISETKNRA